MKKVVSFSFVLSLLIALLFVSCDEVVGDDSNAGDMFNPNGYEYVDLGLPSRIMWAAYNVGATKPEEYGGYYAWGETVEKIDDGKEDVNYNGNLDNKAVLDANNDVARVKWGGSWRMPTFEEFQELIDCCTWEWVFVNDVMGCELTGPNGNSIFFPNAGYLGEKSFHNRGFRGYYWTSSLASYDVEAYMLYFSIGIEGAPNHKSIDTFERTQGLTVRPVCDLK